MSTLLEGIHVILCISVPGMDPVVRRLFLSEIKARKAQSALIKEHGRRIGTWLRSPTQNELLDIHDYVKKEGKGGAAWLGKIDDDTLLSEVVDVRISFFNEYFDSTYQESHYIVEPEYADSVCAKFGARVARMNAKSSERHYFVTRGEKRLALHGEKPEKDLLDEYNKNQ